MLNIKMSTKGSPVFAFILPRGRLVPLPPRQLRHWILHLCLWQSRFSSLLDLKKKSRNRLNPAKNLRVAMSIVCQGVSGYFQIISKHIT